MKNNFIIDKNYFFLALILILTWFKYLNINLFSEDFLVLSFQKNVSITNLFTVFLNKNADGAYWRPLTYLSYRIVELFSPDNIFLHRLASLLIYSALSFALYKFLLTLNIKKDIAFLGTAFFATIYNHELQVAWIPGRTDTLMTLFILLNAIYLSKYYNSGKLKYIFFSMIFFILGILSKEHGIAAAVIPILLSVKEERAITKKSIYIAFIMAIIVLIVFIYRFLVISGSPFSSENFAEISIFSLVKNYFAYFFLSFFRPEELQLSFNFLKDNLFVATFLAVLMIIITFIKRKKILSIKFEATIIFGFLWYSLLIMPALPYLMRWYPFMPSIGLLIIILKLIELNYNEFLKIIIIIFIMFNYVIVNIFFENWQSASDRIEKISDITHIDKATSSKLRIWGLPDKFERINILKIAPDVYFSSIFEASKDSIDSPIRCEYYNNSNISIEKQDQMILMKLTNGRFFPRGAKSTAIFEMEQFNLETDDYFVAIESRFSGENYISILTINNKNDEINDLFFNAVKLIDEKSIK